MGAERFHLDCFADNVRGQRAYTKLGFTRDGVLRKAYRQADGTRARPGNDGDPEERVGRATALTGGLIINESETSLFNGLRRD
jgi:hypothetical protein